MTVETAVITTVRGRHEHLARQRRALTADLHVLVGMGEPAPVPPGPDALPLVVDAGPEGLPLAAARNRGALAALERGAQVLVFLDVDCIPGPLLTARYRSALHRLPGPALVCGPVHYLPPPPAEGYPADGLAALAPPHPARPAPADGELLPETRVELFWSLSFAVTARTWTDLGGFCEDYAGYGGEDTDFVFSARERGARLYWAGGATAYHQHHEPARLSPPRIAEIVRNAHLFRSRWGHWPMRGWLAELDARGDVVFDPGRGLLRTT